MGSRRRLYWEDALLLLLAAVSVSLDQCRQKCDVRRVWRALQQSSIAGVVTMVA